jgi:spore germination protein GerM
MAHFLLPLRKETVENQKNLARLFPLPIQARWLVLIVTILILGAILRFIPSQSLTGDLGAWLPWLNRSTVTLYFADPTGLYLVPVSRPMSVDEDLPHLALKELIQGPKVDAGLQGTIPPDTEIRRLEIRESVAYVDLSNVFLIDRAEEDIAQAVAAVEKTLTALPEVEDVILMVEGQPLEETTDIQPALAEDSSGTLYFVYGDYLTPVEDMIPGEANIPRLAMEAYLQGPPSDGLLAGLPPGTELLNFDFDPNNGLAYVNLTYTEEIRALAIAEPEKMTRTLTSIITTLTEFPEVHAVMLDFEGHAQLGLGQCRSLLRTPQSRPTILNDERTVGF